MLTVTISSHRYYSDTGDEYEGTAYDPETNVTVSWYWSKPYGLRIKDDAAECYREETRDNFRKAILRSLGFEP